nr:EOG090X0D2W [Triops cancriformis]
MNPNDKRYGLIIPSKEKGKALNPAAGFVLQKGSSAAAFGETDSSSDGSDKEPDKDWVGKTMKATAQRSIQQAQARQAALKALQEDPTVFQYDEVYDDMDKVREERKPAKEEKKAKYIETLLKSAEIRQRDYERRLERKIQKERDAEEGQFADKEAFVTSAYKAKMAEMAKVEEDERRRDAIEAAMDVTKQRDLSGFYRHILKQQTEAPKIKQEPKEDAEIPAEEEEARNEEPEAQVPQGSKSPKSHRPRQYRKRKQDESPERRSPSPPPDAESSSESEADEPEAKKSKAEEEKPQTEGETEVELVTVKDEEEEERKKAERLKRKEERRLVWVKRTVGLVFEAALQRYLERKEARESVSRG